MELAVLLAAGLRDWIDFGVIIGILMLNAIVGWYQEKQAADVVASLKGDIALRSTVVRDGAEIEIKARDLVPGDIVSQSISLFLTLSGTNFLLIRLSSKMVKLFLLMPELSARTTTPTVTKLIAENWKHNLENLPTRRMMIMKKERNTDLDTQFLPSINLP
jgi:hypothetical protein